MRFLTFLIAIFCLPIFAQAQFEPSDQGLTIIVTDGTYEGMKSPLHPPGDLTLVDPIRPLGMADGIQAGAFLERPDYGIHGYFLVFCVNDAIGERQGTLSVNGVIYKGIFRLIRQKIAPDEEIPDDMAPYRLSGTVYFLGIS